MKGFLLALQFFTIIPIQKELPMTKKHITMMFTTLPIVGALMGVVATGIFYVVESYTNTTSLLSAFLLFMTFVILTGGLHLDGFVDMGDAYFSYRSIERRHEILEDPRVGAFGAMALVFLVLAKLVFLYEIIVQNEMHMYWLLFVPFLSRLGMSLYLIQTPASKETGIGAFFKAHLYVKIFTTCMIVFLILATTGVVLWSSQVVVPLLLVVLTIAASRLYRYWTLKNFNGSSGDLYGAFIEGMECVLWLVILLSL